MSYPNPNPNHNPSPTPNPNPKQLVRTHRDTLGLNRMTSDDFNLSILHIGSNIMSNRHTYRSLCAIHQYVSIIRSLSTWKSQNTK
jgi:hypothetical protein